MKKLIILLGVLGASFSAIFVRLSAAPSMVLVFWRMLFAAVLLLPAVLLGYRRELREMTLRELGLSCLSGVFLGLHFTLYFSSLRYTTIAASVTLVDTEVFFVAILSILLLKKPVSRGGWLGIGVTFLGSVLIAGSDLFGGSNALLGDLMALLGGGAVSVYTVIGAKVRAKRSTTVYTFLVYTAGAVTVGLMTALFGTSPVALSGRDLLCALGMSVFCTLLGHSVFSWGLRYESPAFISTVKLMEPVFAAILGVILFRELPGIWVVLGGILVILGVAQYARQDSKG